MKYIFDFDGTLVDSMPTWAGAHIKALEKAGIPVPDGFVNTITPLGNYKASEYTISLGLDITLEKYLDDLSRHLYHEYTTNVRLKENVKETLEELIRRGHSLSVLTASPHLYVDECLQNNGVYDLFEKVWSVEDFELCTTYENIGYSKPNPLYYTELAKRIGVEPSECLMVGNDVSEDMVAKNVGMQVFLLTDCLLNKKKEDISGYPQGGFRELMNYLEAL